MLIIRGKNGIMGSLGGEAGLRKRSETRRTNASRILCSEIDKDENSLSRGHSLVSACTRAAVATDYP